MLSMRLAPWLVQRKIHYGWVMVVVTFLTMLATSAAIGMPGVLLVPLRQEFGWDTGSISGAMALRLVLFGAVGPFAAAVMSNWGMRTSICSALGLIAVGLLLATRITAVWQLYLTWGVLVGAGTGMTAIVLAARVATYWFTARRGLVLGLLTSAAATGQLIFLPAAAWIAANYGWRASVLAPMTACLLAFSGVLLLACDHPGNVGLAPFGDPGPARAAPARRTGGSVRLAFGSLGMAARGRKFWLLFGTFAVCGFTTNGLVQTHFIPLCMDYGMNPVTAAWVLALLGGFDFIGALGSGYLSDRYDPRLLLFWYYGLRGISLLILPFSDFSLVGLSVFAVFYGLDWIATVPATVRLAGDAYGAEEAASVFGWIFAGHQAGAAIAAFGAGLTHDAFASYLPAFTTGGVLCLAAAAGALAIPRMPKYRGYFDKKRHLPNLETKTS